MLVLAAVKLVHQVVIMSVDLPKNMMNVVYVVVMAQMMLVVAVLKLVLQAVIMPVNLL